MRYTHADLSAQRQKMGKQCGGVRTIMNTDGRRSPQRCNTKRHDNTLIAASINIAAAGRTAFNNDAIRHRFGLDTEHRQTVSHKPDAFRLACLQRLCAAQNGTPFCAGCGDKQHRKGVDRQGNQRLRDIRTFQPSRTHVQVCQPFICQLANILQHNIGAHQTQNVDRPFTH
ncbi:Phosphatidate phosphatase PAH1 [Pseudomonas syringae pv. actinidiae]|uniref:Phosphatidate phosphatase PAH1 n=1 Tax=Pseudomonas syringae pv. actinidiae TaxID=103796 RepID=A0A2V0QGF0_PSESF|nr:Phosphatidate phosphatase PAH1 [Pseudomonas syringae pv. actinidiae]